MQVASIGPITSQTARDNGLKIDIEAKRHDIDGLVQAILDFVAGKTADKSKSLQR
jgi:uroporphyrinogen III methyltransferase/synthase